MSTQSTPASQAGSGWEDPFNQESLGNTVIHLDQVSVCVLFSYLSGHSGLPLYRRTSTVLSGSRCTAGLHLYRRASSVPPGSRCTSLGSLILLIILRCGHLGIPFINLVIGSGSEELKLTTA